MEASAAHVRSDASCISLKVGEVVNLRINAQVSIVGSAVRQGTWTYAGYVVMNKIPIFVELPPLM